jgi:hypothetical protein
MHEDPIVYPTPPRLIVDLGTRSLVSGVDYNDPKNIPIRICLLFSFSRLRDVMHLHLMHFFRINYFCQILFWFC